MPCAPSPPSTFCQEKVTTSSLAKSRLCAKAAEVASQMVRPLRSAGMKSPFGHAHARGRAVPGEDHVAVEIDAAEIGQLAVVGLDRADVGELQLLDDVGDPALAEALPGEHVDAALRRAATTAPSRRRRCRRPARCRCGSRPAPRAPRGSARSPARAWPCRSWRGASGRARHVVSASSDQPGRFAQGPEEKLGFAGRSPGFARRRHRGLSFQIASPSLGRGGPRTAICRFRLRRQEESLCRKPGHSAAACFETKTAGRSPPSVRSERSLYQSS